MRDKSQWIAATMSGWRSTVGRGTRTEAWSDKSTHSVERIRWRKHFNVLVDSLVPAASKSTKHSPESLSISSLGCHRGRSRFRPPFRYIFTKKSWRKTALLQNIPMDDRMYSTATSRTGCSQYYRLSYTRLVPFIGCSIGLYRDVWIAAIASSRKSLATQTAAICVRFHGRRARHVYVTMQITFLARKSALIYRRGLRQRVASLTIDCNGVFAIRAYGSLCEHGPALLYFGASASSVQLGRA